MSQLGNMADVVARLARAPRTVNELCEVTGIGPSAVRRYIAALKGEGVIEAKRLPSPPQRGGKGKIQYRWSA